MAAVTKTDKMICPSCRVEMNHHGDKLVYISDPQDDKPADPDLGGLIDEFHTCPRCGGGASRHA
jgi:ribosomal protein S27AE